jgi:hypothetical protein
VRGMTIEEARPKGPEEDADEGGGALEGGSQAQMGFLGKGAAQTWRCVSRSALFPTSTTGKSSRSLTRRI